MAGGSSANGSANTPVIGKSVMDKTSTMDTELIDIPTEDHDFSSQSICKLLQQLVSSVNEVKLQTTAASGMKDSVLSCQALQDSLGDRLNQVEELLLKTNTKLNLVGNFMIRQEEQFESLQSEIRQFKRSKVKSNLIIRGIIEEAQESVDKCKELAKKFFKDQMEIQDEVELVKAHRIGVGNKGDRPMLVKLSDIRDKATIFKSVSKLKGKENAKSVDDDLDPIDAETKNYYRDLVKENKEWDEDKKLQIKMHRGKIYANNQQVKPLLYAPTAARILTMTDKEMEDVKAVKLIKSEEFMEKGFEYISYVQRIRNVRDVQKGLYKVKIKYADATHVSCAYRLDQSQGPFGQEYFDDEETGVGRAILQAIKDRAATAVAVFVVRYYGGTKLGKRCFEIATTITTAALASLQYRSAHKQHEQHVLSQSSIASTISSAFELSEDESGPPLAVQLPTNVGLPQEDGEEITSQEDKFSSTTEGATDP